MLVDAERTLVAAGLADFTCYTYTLFAFVVHALSGSSEHEGVFAAHDEPELLVHALHGVVGLLVLCAFACGAGSLSLASLRAVAFVATTAALVDVAAVYVHVAHAREGSHASAHAQPVGYLYAALAAALAVTSCCVARQARSVGRALDPIVYGTPKTREASV